MVRREHTTPYLFLLPAMALLVLWRYVPIIWGLRESFYSNALSLTGGREFVGFNNFKWLFDDPGFWKSLRVTLVFNLLVNPLQVTLALALAMLANQRLRGISNFRTILLLPVAISINVSCLAWGLALDTNYGLVNGMLDAVGFGRQPFLRSPDQALPSMIGIVSWIGIPYWMLFFLAGLQGIPNEILEAARIDGASRVQAFCHVTVPLLRRVIAFVFVSDTLINIFLFAPPYLLTRGGPQGATNLMMYDAWRRGLVYGDLGASAAMVLILLIVAFVIITIELVLLRPKH
ncbi:MAG: sugar ABC transporter permease [Chloroflexota bacterium]